MNPQRGNALFLILIAVALFAALSYTITQSARGGGSVSNQQDYIYAAQIVQIGADLKAGVLTMTLNGTSATSIVTNTPSGAKYAGNGSLNGYADFCTSGVTCLFAPEGGGVTVPIAPRNAFLLSAAWATWIPHYFAGTGSFNGVWIDGLMPGAGSPDVGIQGIGTAAYDDLVEIYPLTHGVCATINKGLGISGIPSESSAGGPTTWIATTGLESACITFLGETYRNVYYQVLVAN